MDTASGLKGIQGQPRCDCPPHLSISTFFFSFICLSVCYLRILLPMGPPLTPSNSRPTETGKEDSATREWMGSILFWKSNYRNG